MKYFAPCLIALLYLACVLTNSSLYFILLLFVLNQLSPLFGYYNAASLKQELTYFYGAPSAQIIKGINSLVIVCVLIYTHYFIYSKPDLSTANFIGTLIAALSLFSTFIFPLGHEWIHSKNPNTRVLGRVMLLLIGFPFFPNDHIHGHHQELQNNQDPSVAAYGEHLYQYMYRIIPARLKANLLEKGYLGTTRGVSAKCLENWISLAAFIGIVGMITWMGSGTGVVVFFVAHCVLNYLFYEIINYVQHYGIGNTHALNTCSWNNYNKYTCTLTFLLPVHSVHHMGLDVDEKMLMGPELPGSYFHMILLSLFPPIWFRKMNPLVNQLNAVHA